MVNILIRNQGERSKPLSVNDFIESLKDSQQRDSATSTVLRTASDDAANFSQISFPPSAKDRNECYGYFLALESFFSGFYGEVLTEIDLEPEMLDDNSNLASLQELIYSVQQQYAQLYVDMFIFFIGERDMDSSPHDDEIVWDVFGNFLFELAQDENSQNSKIAKIEEKFKEWIEKNFSYYIEGYSQFARVLNGAVKNAVHVLIKFYEMIGKSREEAMDFTRAVIEAKAGEMKNVKEITDTTRRHLVEVNNPEYVNKQLEKIK